MNDTDIIFYSERGIVNGIILDIKDDLNKEKAFLRSIRFADGGVHDWIDDVKLIKWYVEPSFSQFGAPDLILSAETKDLKKYIIIIEAKLTGYNESSASNIENDLYPANYRGITSSLNIQLAFKYRFYQAFKNKINEDAIRETGNTKIFYNDQRRKIKNLIVIDYCKELFGKATEVYYVALTHDNKNFIPFETDSFLPAIGKENWKNDKKFFGHLTYDMLETVAWNNSNGDLFKGIIAKDKGYYGTAAKKLDTKAPVMPTNNKYESISKIKGYKKWSQDQTKLAEYAIKKYIKKSKKLNGYYSLIIGNITAIEIHSCAWAKEKGILICFSLDGLQDDYKDTFGGKVFAIGVGQKRKAFYCCAIKGKSDIRNLRKFIQDFTSRYEVKLNIV